MSVEVSINTRLRERLRLETDDIHQRLHRHPAMLRLMSDECSRDHYLEILKAFFIFYSEGEDFHHRMPVERRFIHEATPLEWLQQDFSTAGIAPALSVGHANLLKKYREPYFQREPTLASYIGYLYVKQGSTLGGQTISKHLQKHFVLDARQTQHFFNGFGERTGGIWREFLEYLSVAETDVDADDVVLSARYHFLNLEYVLNQLFTAGDDDGNR